MANENLVIKRGTSSTLPAKQAGQILVKMSTGTSDGTGTMYVDDSTSKRVRIVDDTKLPLTGGTVTGEVSFGDTFLISSSEFSGINNSHYFLRATKSSFSVGFPVNQQYDGDEFVVSTDKVGIKKLLTIGETGGILQDSGIYVAGDVTVAGSGRYVGNLSHSLTVGSKIFNNSSDISVTLTDLGTFTATATGLSAGSSPTVTVDGTKFTFGIPKGDTGASAGFATAMGVTTTTGAAGTNASVTITPDSSTPNTDKKFNFAFTIPRGADGLTTAIKLGNRTTNYTQSGGVITIPAADILPSTGTTTTLSELNYVHGVTSSIQTQLNSKIPSSQKGVANGVASLDSTGRVPSSQLPSYVDDVVEGYLSGGKFYEESAHTTEIAGEAGKIYVDLSTNKTYRWSSTTFVEISSSLALGETSSTAYRGDRGKAAYDHATAKGSAFTSGLYKITTNAQGHVTATTEVVKGDITALGIPGEDHDTTYIGNRGISLVSGAFGHSNTAVTAKTAKTDATKTLTWGGNFKVDSVMYDTYGHMTGHEVITFTMPANPNTDTHWTAKNIVGALATAISNAATTNTTTFLNLIENGAVRSSHQIKGAGSVTVSANASGVVTITGTDTDTKVTNTLNTTAKAYVTGTTTATTNTGTQVFDTGVYLDTTAGRLTATTFKGTLQGNASTSSKWSAARTITVSGNASGSVSIDGSANATLSLTVNQATSATNVDDGTF